MNRVQQTRKKLGRKIESLENQSKKTKLDKKINTTKINLYRQNIDVQEAGLVQYSGDVSCAGLT